MTPEQLSELLTHVYKTYGITAMLSMWVAFDNSSPDCQVEYGTRAYDYYHKTCDSLQQLDK